MALPVVAAIAAAGALAVAGVAVLGNDDDGGGGGARDAADGFTVVYAVGDAGDDSAETLALARYVRSQLPDRFFYLGDVYDTGTRAEFDAYYEQRFGSLADVTDPVIGNHEYGNRNSGYYPYWKRKRGWSRGRARHRAYVDRLSGWQVIAYSSEHDPKREARWVGRRIAARGGTCRIVMAHKGRHVVADDLHGDVTSQEPVWRRFVGKAAINLVAHNHLYGRLAPIRGTHVIVSGAGGHHLRRSGRQHHRVRSVVTGVPSATRILLRRGAAEVRQVDADGRVRDRKTIRCTPA